MTLKELSQLYYLNCEITANQREVDIIEAKIARLDAKIKKLQLQASTPSSPNLTGVPSSGAGFKSGKLDKYAGEVDELERKIRENKAVLDKHSEKIRKNQALREPERDRLEEYIAQIPESLIRQIFKYRFVDGLTWDQVAGNISPRTTTDSVKKACYRFINGGNIPKN